LEPWQIAISQSNRRKPVPAIADHDKLAANFANEHESEMIRVLRVDSRLFFLVGFAIVAVSP
jgi:hypothetical protein